MAVAAPSPFVARDPAFAAVAGDGARLVHVADVPAHEGPVWVEEDGALYVTSLPRPRPGDAGPLVSILRLRLDGLALDRVDVVREDANAANGMTLAPDGRLLVCEQGSRSTPARLALVDRASGRSETLVDALEGAPLSSPNDVVVGPDGAVWFTDPSYGHLQGFRPRPALPDAVHRYDPRTGAHALVATSLDKPNGLAFSPDGRTLVVGDSGANHEPGSFDPRRPHELRAFDVVPGGLARERLLAVTEPGFPDGVKVDAAGRVYATSFAGIQVRTPAGALLGEIRLPGAVNLCFGGPERNVLFVTADTAVWAAVLTTRGA